MNIRISACILLVPVLLGCGGCSRIGFGYDHADRILRYWVSDYTSFNAQQQEEIRHAATDYMRWHRAYALPEYTAFLQHLQVLVERNGELTATDIMHVREEIARLYGLTMTPLVHPAAHVLSTLDSRQIAGLHHTLADRTHHLWEELLPGDEQENLMARAKGHVKFVEWLAGSLSDEQKRQVTALSLQIPFVSGDYLRQREEREAALISLLNGHADEEKIAAFFMDWISQQSYTSRQQATSDYDRTLNEMIARTYGLLNAQQKTRLREKISDYIDAFRKLHSAIDPRSAALAH